MTSESPGPDKIDSKKRKLGVGGCLLIMFGLLAIAILIPVVGYITWSRGAAKRLEAIKSEIRAKGEPVTMAELNTFYALPADTTDTTEMWLDAVAPFDTREFNDSVKNLPIVGTAEKVIPPIGEEWEDLEAVEALLAAHSGSMRLMHEAAAKGGYARFQLNFEDGFSMLLPQVQQMRAGTRMLNLERHARAHRGDVDGVAESIHTAAMLGRSLENQPILVSQLVSMATDGIAHGMLEETLPYLDFSDEQLSRLQSALRVPDYREACHRAMIGERAMGLDVFDNPEKLGTEGPGAVMIGRGDDKVYYAQTMTQMVDGLGKSWTTAFDASDAMNADMQQKMSGSALNRARYMTTMLILPATDAAINAAARTDANRQLADAALAIERYRLANGKLPTSLNELAPKFIPSVPMDPFSGQPIRYSQDPSGYKLYSVGQNRIDDGGIDDETGMPPDFVFRVDFTDVNSPSDD